LAKQKYRENKREEKATLKVMESQNEVLKHNNRGHKYWAKTYQNEAEALKLETFPDKILCEVSKGGKMWIADKHAQVPIKL
jgi:hypothetical protein